MKASGKSIAVRCIVCLVATLVLQAIVPVWIFSAYGYSINVWVLLAVVSTMFGWSTAKWV